MILLLAKETFMNWINWMDLVHFGSGHFYGIFGKEFYLRIKYKMPPKNTNLFALL